MNINREKMPQSSHLIESLKKIISLNPKSASLLALAIGVLIWFKKSRTASKSSPSVRTSSSSSSKRGLVDRLFFSRLWKLTKIVIPSYASRECFWLISLSVFLVLRTYLTISISDIKGAIVKAIVTKKGSRFALEVRNI
jgi:hypothetical protein